MSKELAKTYDPKGLEERLYQKWLDNKYFHAEVNRDKKPFTIVMPPPNVTGQLHMGHALDETMQDILIRFKRMQGYEALWQPGTDHAAIATEVKVIEKLKEQGINKEDLGREEFLKHAWAWKEEYGGKIINQLKKLGASADWDRERFTMDEGCSKAVKEVFIRLYEKGYIYKGSRIINWCPVCQTSISDAEVEHEDQDGFFWHINYPIVGEEGRFVEIATTRPETLLGDTAVAVNPEDERYKDLIGKMLKLPLTDREIPVIADEYVDKEFGTGCVKITPAHDPNDFEVGKRHNLEEINIMNDDATINDLGGKYAGMDRYEARKAMVKDLEELGLLVKVVPHSHSVGTHDRCGTTVEPMIKPQWFVRMKEMGEAAIKTLQDGNLTFVPERFDKIYMHWLETIRDWCISRQRRWGVPIPIFYCKDCGEPLIEKDAMHAVSELFRAEGSDAWYIKEAEEILPAGTKCKKCGCTSFTKERDIMDVWFDSGVTHAAVCDTRDYLHWPADLYLEGADQYRGWFQSSLLTSIAWRGKAPYKAVVTHGWVVDGQGRKMSKSLGNGILPQEIVDKYGADILRLWVASSDYHADIRISPEILKQLSDAYRKIRNTARYMLGNLSDFNPDTDSVEVSEMLSIDKWALNRLDRLMVKVREGYESFEFHQAYHAIHNFCVVDMSNFYLDVIKDRLYTEKKDSAARRAAQTAMYIILDAMTRLVAPILAFTSDEIWQSMPHASDCDARHVVYNEMPKPTSEKYGIDVTEEFIARWDRIHAIRDVVKKALENARAEKTIGASLDAKVTLFCTGELYAFLKSVEDELATVFIVSQVEIVDGEGGTLSDDALGLSVQVDKAEGCKCMRCWTYSSTVGKNPAYVDLCERCAKALSE